MQIIDTVELFHLPRSRKLSLRFLASYLLRASIQEHTHDSIEDAATALALYRAYRDLQEAGPGVFQAKLAEMYDFGKAYGFGAVLWQGDTPHPAPEPAPGPSHGAGGGGGMAGQQQQQQYQQQQPGQQYQQQQQYHQQQHHHHHHMAGPPRPTMRR